MIRLAKKKNNFKQNKEVTKKVKQDVIELEGLVEDVIPGGEFIVTLENKHVIKACVSVKYV